MMTLSSSAPVTPELAPSPLRRAAGLASRAPSLHNSQPWLWHVDGSLLHLHADRRRHLPMSDPDRRGMYLSCGIILHHMRVALAAFGWATTVERFPDTRDPNHVAVLRTTPAAPTAADQLMARVILLRRSDRRRFSSWPVPDHCIESLTTRASREGVLLERLELSSALTGAVHTACEIHAGDGAYRSEIEGWSGSSRVADGVPGRNVPLSVVSGDVFPPRRFAAAALAQAPNGYDSDDASSYLGVATPGDDHFSHLRAGEATSAVLLEATSFGLSTCPISEPLEVSSTRQVFQQNVMSSGCFPQLVIRMGWARPNAEPLPVTPRRPVSQILTMEPVAQVGTGTGI